MAVVITAIVALAVAGLAASIRPGPQLELTDGPGALAMTNSRDGLSLLTAAGMKPGDSASDEVTVANTGTLAGTISLSSTEITDDLGLGGARLSERLDLTVERLDGAGTALSTVYEGPLGALDRIELGSIEVGREHRYRLTVLFPNGGTPTSSLTGDNAFQGSSTSVGYRWDATEPESPGDGGEGGGGSGSGGGGGSGGGSGSGGGGGSGSGGGSGGSGAEGSPGLPVAPAVGRVQLSRTRAQRLGRRRAVTVWVNCPHQCSTLVTGIVTLPKSGRRVRTRPQRVTLSPTVATRVRLRLPPSSERIVRGRLARGQRLVLRVTVTATSPTGQSETARSSIRLLP